MCTQWQKWFEWVGCKYVILFILRPEKSIHNMNSHCGNSKLLDYQLSILGKR